MVVIPWKCDYSVTEPYKLLLLHGNGHLPLFSIASVYNI